MKKIRLVHIGVAHDHSMPNFECIASMPETFDLLGFVRVPGEEDYNPGFNKNFPDVPLLTLEEAFAIPDLDAVSVDTTDLELVKYATMAAERGLHVFMDKPGSQQPEDFEHMLSVIRKHGKVFCMGYMYRFHPFIQQALEMVKEGKLGEIYAVEAHMSRDDKMEKRQWLGQFKGGMTFYLGCHLIDLIHTFLGVPEEVIPMNTCATKEVGTEDLGMVLFRYPGGLSFCKACGAEPGGFMRRQLVICGTLGSLEIRPLEQYTCGIPYYCDSVLYTSLRKEPDKPLAWVKPAEVTPCEPYHRYRGVFEDFAQKIRSGKPTSEEELLREARVHRILLASCGIDCDYKGEITL